MAEGQIARSEAEHDFAGSTADLFEEIARLTEVNRAAPDRDAERRVLWLRHLAGIRLAQGTREPARHPAPSTGQLPAHGAGLPDFSRADITPELLRAAILRDGCMLVRGLVDRTVAVDFAAKVDRAFAERAREDSGGRAADGYYEEFRPQAPLPSPPRVWIKNGGGLLAADSPMLAFEMLDMFEAAGVPKLVAAYLGAPAALSVQKTTLRKVEPTVTGAWHQDGAFMGDVRSVNIWLSLSRCGDEAPGLDIVPRRLDSLVPTGTEGTFLPDQVSQATADAAAGDLRIVRPIFEPGDALIFDELCLHQTASDPSMSNTRFAIETWFFGCSTFPSEYAPIAV